MIHKTVLMIKLHTLRDLEDFARLHIEVPELLADLPELSYSLKFESIPGESGNTENKYFSCCFGQLDL